MVTLTGVKAAQPIALEIDTLQAAFDALDKAAKEPSTEIWKMDIRLYIYGEAVTISVDSKFSNVDTAAILYSIRNIIGTKINVKTNDLGAIS